MCYREHWAQLLLQAVHVGMLIWLMSSKGDYSQLHTGRCFAALASCLLLLEEEVRSRAAERTPQPSASAYSAHHIYARPYQ
eukprot:832504-Prymnesium_polylepis.1